MKIGFVGLGFAGYPLAVMFAQKFRVTGVDIDKEKVEKINAKTYKCTEEGIEEYAKKAMLEASTDIKDVGDCDIVFLSLPSTSEDFSVIEKTLEKLDSFCSKDVVILSTIYPGFTRKMQNVCKNIKISFVPIRTFEGKVVRQFHEFPHIIGTFDDASYERVSRIFEDMGCKVAKAIPPEKAELAKLFSNSFRQAEFAIAGELGEIAKLHGFESDDIFRLTNEGDPNRRIKKHGVWGGYCLPKDTKMLISHAKSIGYDANLLSATESLRRKMAEIRASGILRKHQGKALLFHGITSKPVEEKIHDMRDSPVVDVIRILKKSGAKIKIADPNLHAAELKKIAAELGVEVASEADFSTHAVIRHTNYDIQF